MILNPDHPAYSDQPDERDPTWECAHLVPYTRPCADCDAEDREADEERVLRFAPCADCDAEDREADEEPEHE